MFLIEAQQRIVGILQMKEKFIDFRLEKREKEKQKRYKKKKLNFITQEMLMRCEHKTNS